MYLCVFVLVSLTLTFKYLFLQLAAWHFKLLGYFGQPAPLSSIVCIYLYFVVIIMGWDKVQLNLSTTATLGTEESGRYGEVGGVI